MLLLCNSRLGEIVASAKQNYYVESVVGNENTYCRRALSEFSLFASTVVFEPLLWFHYDEIVVILYTPYVMAIAVDRGYEVALLPVKFSFDKEGSRWFCLLETPPAACVSISVKTDREKMFVVSVRIDDRQWSAIISNKCSERK